MIIMNKLTIVIENISEADQTGYLAKIYGTKYQIVESMADTMPELFTSIQQTLEEIKN